MLLVGAGILALAATYVLMLIAGNLFKHMKKEDTPFTAGNVRRLRLLGVFHIVFWACGIAMGYFVGCEFIRRLGLPSTSVNLSLNLTALLLSLVYFFLARVFSFGKVQGDTLREYLPAPTPEPEPAPEPAPAPVYEKPAPAPVKPEPVYQAPAAPAEPLYTEPVAQPEPAPEPAPVEPAPAEPVKVEVEPVELPEE
jgi:hypothetical protein